MIYNTIYRLAQKKGMSIHQLEVKAGLEGMIGRWREYYPSYKNLVKVADALNLSLNTLRREIEKDEKEEGDSDS